MFNIVNFIIFHFLGKSTFGINFTNVKRTNFLYERCFGSFEQTFVQNGFEQTFVRKMRAKKVDEIDGWSHFLTFFKTKMWTEEAVNPLLSSIFLHNFYFNLSSFRTFW
jgi:hypothetical protein